MDQTKMKIRTKFKEHGNVESSFNYFLKFNISKKAKILDIGCNYGSLIYNLYKLGYKNVYGIDTNKDSIEKGKKTYKPIRKKLISYDGKRITFRGETFDVVLMFDVIEHIPNIQGFLKNEVYRILKTRGIFIFQTPNKIINIPWEIIHQKSFSKWKNYHCSLQTKRSLKNVLNASNFKDVKIEKFNILTQHNKEKVKQKMGIFGLDLLYMASKMPLSLSPNFWGVARR